MNYDPNYYPYPSRRILQYGARGMVATSQPLAAGAGLDILKRGGNAIDAAIATAATLTVVEPSSNGIGSDAFALVWSEGKLHGLNASGPAPSSASAEAMRRRGHDTMPRFGVEPVTVPGAPAAWAELAERFGRLPLTETLEPAIRYAEEGYPVSPVLAGAWSRALARYSTLEPTGQYRPWLDTFAPNGCAPAAGDMWRSPGHAATLRAIAESNGEAFYRGDLAERIETFITEYDGFLTADDLAAFEPEWVQPISVDYRGYRVWEIPPNGQGLVALIALNILRGFDFDARDEVETFHRQIEAIKLGFADGLKYITDSRAMQVPVEDLLSDAYAEERRRMIGREALDPVPGTPPSGGTVYLCTGDSEGNMVSFIQSNYMGFGSGVVIPGTGISLQNRGANFSLDPGHDNVLAGGKRTYHTIIPGFLTRGEEPIGPFGVMGGFMQPQGHLQVVANVVDFGLNPQAALDAPRWQWSAGRTVSLEHSVPEHIGLALAARGHDIGWALGSGGFGRGQIVWRHSDDVLVGATEPRADGAVMAW